LISVWGNVRISSTAGYEILNDVVIYQVLVDFGDDEKTQRIIDGVQADGRCWMSRTTWHGKHAMRISVLSWATTSEDVERSVAAILKVAAKVGYPYGDAQHLLEPDKINRGRAEK
jgi:threonine aldolase